jgi:PAP2 superfamily
MLTRLHVAVAAIAVLSVPAMARADMVLTWNDLALKTLVMQGQTPFSQGRYMAIVQLAVFEAVNAVTGDYEPYIGVVAPVGASADAAAATAAYRVLKTYFPAASLIDNAYADSLDDIPDGPAKNNGVVTGEAAAAAMIARRVGDNSSSPLTVSPVGPPVAGQWQLTLPPGCSATATGGSFYHWQDVTPFGIASVQEYLLPPPPDITSNLFAKAYNEVERIGAVDSTSRPTHKSNLARFYQASSPAYVFNLAARQVSEEQHLSLSENARAFALLNIASSDSLVASFYNKYHYNYWRPENAIRFTDDFGNPKVQPNSSYVPYITTPCFPSYPSNHASGSNGAAEILRRIFGAGNHHIVMTNPLNSAIATLEFTYTTFKQITNDIDDARVYGGIHYRFDQVAGADMGRAIATEVYKHNLRRVRTPE